MSDRITIRRGERCRTYPENGQPSGFRRIGGACRLLWNVALEQRRTFSRRGRYIGYHEQSDQLAELKEAYPFFAEVPHHCLQQTLRDLDNAFQRFFKGQAGYPKPKRKRDGGDTFRFPDPAQFRIWVGHNGWAWLTLPKFGTRGSEHGEIRMRMHRPLPLEAKVTSVTISQEAEWWFASLSYEAEVEAPPEHTGEAVGGDMGVEVPLMLSTGESFDVPRQTERQRERERRLERSLARKKRGSRNKAKARRALARHRSKVRRRRLDALRKIAATVAKNHGLIVLEDLNVKNMTASAAGTVESPWHERGAEGRVEPGDHRDWLVHAVPLHQGGRRQGRWAGCPGAAAPHQPDLPQPGLRARQCGQPGGTVDVRVRGVRARGAC